MLYCQLERAKVDEREYKPIPVLGLTSNQITGFCHSTMNEGEMGNFFSQNRKITQVKLKQLQALFNEARQNNFFVYLANAKEEFRFRPKLIEAFNNSR